MIDIGFVVGLIFAGLGALGALSATVLGFKDDDYIGRCIGIVGLFIVLGLTLALAFPFDMAYHSYRPVHGTVEAIGKRLLGGKDNLSEKYAIRFKGSPQIYGCEDTRCSVAKPGDTLKLNCIRSWQWASVHGYDCRYAQ